MVRAPWSEAAGDAGAGELGKKPEADDEEAFSLDPSGYVWGEMGLGLADPS